MSTFGNRLAWGRHENRPLIIGHRGSSLRFTENTAEAFAGAAQDGADGVELDVLLCGTGEVVVFHDDDLFRLGGSPDRVDLSSFSRLRRVSLRGGGRIPTLDEAISACGPNMLINVELKARPGFDPHMLALVDGVFASLQRMRASERIIVSSFSIRAVAAWQRVCPQIPVGLLIEADTLAMGLRALALPVLRPFAVHPDKRLVTADLVSRCHARGYAVNTWTCDAPEGLRKLRTCGVDGIITNDPAAARVALTTERSESS